MKPHPIECDYNADGEGGHDWNVIDFEHTRPTSTGSRSEEFTAYTCVCGAWRRVTLDARMELK